MKNSYADKIKDLLHKLNFDHVWTNHTTFSKRKLLFSIVNKMKDIFLKFWNKTLNDDSKSPNGNKLRTYRKFKTKFDTEMYLSLNLDRSIIKNWAKSNCAKTELICATT